MKKVSLGVICIMAINLSMPIVGEASEIAEPTAEVSTLAEEEDEEETSTTESSDEDTSETTDSSDSEETEDSSEVEEPTEPGEGEVVEPEIPVVTPDPVVPEEKPVNKPSKPAEKPAASQPSNQGGNASSGQSAGTTTASAANSGSTTSISGGTVSFSRTLTTEQFILTIGETARDIGQENDLYASVMIAQAILESGSGSSSLSGPPNFNLFGIKGAYKGHSISFPTQEDSGSGSLYTITSSFRKYSNYKESCEDYADLLKQDFYSGTWKKNASTPQDAASYLQGRYATDTSYAAKLNGLIETYELTEYDKPFVPSAEETLETHAVKKGVLQYLGVPYVWGGTQPTGFDCSGLVQYVFKESLNMDTGRVTTDQEHLGREIPLDQLRTGDLLFWGSRGATTHVGVYIGNNLFVHAPQTGDVVKVTILDSFKPDFAKRIFGMSESE